MTLTPLNAGRKDKWSLRLTVDGRDTGVWDTLSGGSIDSEETLYHPGGMADPISLGGRQTFENLTLEREMDQLEDADLTKWLAQRAGKATFTMTRQALNGDRIAIDGSRLTYTGTLKLFQPPEIDSESNDAAKLHVELTVSGVV
jgi:hypothetical protein